MSYPQNTWQRYDAGGIPYAIDADTNRVSVGTDLLSDFKDHVRVVGTDEDTELTRYLNTAARDLEDMVDRLLIQASVVEYYDVWPWDYLNCVHLHRAPVASVTSIKYYDTADVQQTWDSANYDVDLVNEPARIVVAEAATLSSPSIDQRLNCVEITYTTGLADATANLDAQTINAIMVRAAYLYGCGRELIFSPGVADSVERCWQHEMRRLVWRP